MQVLQEVAEQEVQLADEDLIRLLPPPIPKEEMSFWISGLPQLAQETLFSPPMETIFSK